MHCKMADTLNMETNSFCFAEGYTSVKREKYVVGSHMLTRGREHSDGALCDLAQYKQSPN